MNLRKKYEAAKTKIQENPGLTLTVAATTTYALINLAISFHNKQLLDKERKAHAGCHSTAKWLYQNTGEGTDTTISVKDDHYYIVAKFDTPTED